MAKRVWPADVQQLSASTLLVPVPEVSWLTCDDERRSQIDALQPQLEAEHAHEPGRQV